MQLARSTIKTVSTNFTEIKLCAVAAVVTFAIRSPARTIGVTQTGYSTGAAILTVRSQGAERELGTLASVVAAGK